MDTDDVESCSSTGTAKLVIAGIALAAAVTAVVHWPLANVSHIILACFLASTATVYPSTAIARGAVSRKILLEVGASVVIFSLAVSALASDSPHYSAWAIAGGYTLHAVWDWLHHSAGVGTPVVAWFPPVCAGFDFAIAIATVLAVMQITF